jgi:hypothetical protein
VSPLLAAVLHTAGNPYAEPGLVFTFSVGDVSRTHRWDIPHGKAEVTWKKDGKTCRVVVPVPYAGDDALQTEAFAIFTNDQYWLLAPSKLGDPGVHVEQQGNDLLVGFDAVGLTPGDHYTFHVDPASGVVTGWEFVLQGGRTGSFTWAPPVAVGQLHLSLERTSGDKTIRFTDVRSEPVPLGDPGGSCG